MYNQIRGDTLFTILYAVVAAMAMIAGCYLLFRRANAIAPNISPPIRLRRWTGIFLISLALNQVWYMQLFFLTSSEDVKMADLIGGLIQSVTLFPIAIVVLLAMLQDRRRPLWPFVVMIAPAVSGLAACVVSRSKALFPVIYAYDLPLTIGIISYMARALRQYGRWLRDNYADLEHKEIWHSFIVLVIILLAFTINELCDNAPVYEYVMLVVTATLICYLLWRVETLSDLTIQEVSGYEVASLSGYDVASTDNLITLKPDNLITSQHDNLETSQPDNLITSQPDNLKTSQPDNLKTLQPKDLTSLLQRHCIDTQLYLQYDLNITQLAKAIGTNRFYLSQYFSSLGITYNTYVNDLRINHFTNLYREAVAANRHFTAQQLASDSGYRSYSTFRLAFQQRMGQNVRAWMNDMAQNSQK